MRFVTLASPIDFPGWRDAARRLITEGVAPADVRFTDHSGETGLFAHTDAPASDAPAPSSAFRVPRAFVELAEQAALHRGDDRFDLLYRLLWRLRGEPALMTLASDPDVVRVNAMVKAVRQSYEHLAAGTLDPFLGAGGAEKEMKAAHRVTGLERMLEIERRTMKR